jgi:predicted nucleic acid-binding protein
MTTKPGLLDINVLIALMDPAHRFHAPAHRWFKSHRSHGWATCPITENGCLRSISHPGYPFPGLTVERVRGILTEQATASGPTRSAFSNRNASISPKPARSISRIFTY